MKERIEELARECAAKFGEWEGWDSDTEGPNGNDAEDERQFWRSVVLHISNEALELAANECDKLAWSNKNTAMLGPENNCVRCAEAIRKLKAKE